ncbi:hypothetical protein BGZ54_008463 [Gamsiella multidivaricata]|nr:hypothetical protein BGZ54_008463 [Gamsiella multidivaricata]
MIRSYESAKYDILWVYDSNVYVDPGCMGRSIDKMLQPNVGLVHHLPFGVRPQTLGSDLELMFLDTVHAKMYLFINWTGLASCVVGKSSLYRRSILDKVGGLSKFGKYMAEDNLIATEIFNMGYKHEMTSDLAYQSLGSMTPSDYFLRRARWTRIRKYTVTAATIVEPFIEMIGCGLVASYGFNLLWQTHFLNFLAFHIVVWFLIDLSMYQALSGENVDNLRGFLMTWCLREVAALPLYVYAVLGSTVDWRDQTFLLQRDGTVLPLEVPTPEAGIARDDKDDHSTSSSSDPSSSRSLMGTVSVPPASPTSLAPTTTFANLANTVVPQSTQVSLRNFFRRPAVISLVSSTFAVIHFVVDILIKSQRNGNDEDDKDDLADDDIEEPFFTEGEDDEGDLETDQSGTRTKSTLLLVKRPRHLLQQRSSSGSASGCSAPKKYRAAAEENTDESQHYDTAGEQEFVPRRSERIRMRLALSSPPSSESFTPKSKSKSKSRSNSRIPVSVFSNTKSETEAEHGRRSMEEDALSIAVEPYLSDSLSRRGGIRRELSASSQFLSV